MRFSTMLFGAATLVGIGVYVGKKFIENKDDKCIIAAEEKETYSDKFHKASMFAVGAVKTSADKIAEGIKEIKSKDMVKKGEETIDQAKEAAEQIKKDIDDLKNMVVSINVSIGENEESNEIINTANNEQQLEENFDSNESESTEPVPASYEDVMETGPSDLNNDI